MARETYLDTLGAALYAGRLAVGGSIREVAEAARWAPAAPEPAQGPDLMLDGLALLIIEGYAAGMPGLKRALQAFRSGHISNTEGMRWLWLACHVAIIGWDWETWRKIFTGRRSTASDAAACALSRPAPTCSTASGCAASAAGVMPAISFAPPMMGRAAEAGDELGSRLLSAGLAGDLLWLAFALSRRMKALPAGRPCQ